MTELILKYASLLDQIDISTEFGKQERAGLEAYLRVQNARTLDLKLRDFEIRVSKPSYTRHVEDRWLWYLLDYEKRGTIHATTEDRKVIQESTELRRAKVRAEMIKNFPYLFISPSISSK